MEQLLQLDEQFFYFINGDLSNPIFDFVLPLLRNKFFWIPLYAYFLYLIFNTFKKRGWLVLFGFLFTIAIADNVSNRGFKKNIERPRPCQTLQDINERVHCGGGYSFTSNHATNHFAMAFYMIMAFGFKHKRAKAALIGWAAAIAFAQVYVGVHYPLDVLAGGVLGALIGWLVGLGAREDLKRIS